MKLYLPIPKVSVWGLLSHLSFGEKIQGRRAHKEGTKRSYPEEQPRSNVSPSLTKLLHIASYSRGPDLGTKDMPQEGQLGSCMPSAQKCSEKAELNPFPLSCFLKANGEMKWHNLLFSRSFHSLLFSSSPGEVSWRGVTHASPSHPPAQWGKERSPDIPALHVCRHDTQMEATLARQVVVPAALSICMRISSWVFMVCPVFRLRSHPVWFGDLWHTR